MEAQLRNVHHLAVRFGFGLCLFRLLAQHDCHNAGLGRCLIFRIVGCEAFRNLENMDLIAACSLVKSHSTGLIRAAGHARRIRAELNHRIRYRRIFLIHHKNHIALAGLFGCLLSRLLCSRSFCRLLRRYLRTACQTDRQRKRQCQGKNATLFFHHVHFPS